MGNRQANENSARSVHTVCKSKSETFLHKSCTQSEFCWPAVPHPRGVYCYKCLPPTPSPPLYTDLGLTDFKIDVNGLIPPCLRKKSSTDVECTTEYYESTFSRLSPYSKLNFDLQSQSLTMLDESQFEKDNKKFQHLPPITSSSYHKSTFSRSSPYSKANLDLQSQSPTMLEDSQFKKDNKKFQPLPPITSSNYSKDISMIYYRVYLKDEQWNAKPYKKKFIKPSKETPEIKKMGSKSTIYPIYESLFGKRGLPQLSDIILEDSTESVETATIPKFSSFAPHKLPILKEEKEYKKMKTPKRDSSIDNLVSLYEKMAFNNKKRHRGSEERAKIAKKLRQPLIKPYPISGYPNIPKRTESFIAKYTPESEMKIVGEEKIIRNIKGIEAMTSEKPKSQFFAYEPIYEDVEMPPVIQSHQFGTPDLTAPKKSIYLIDSLPTTGTSHFYLIPSEESLSTQIFQTQESEMEKKNQDLLRRLISISEDIIKVHEAREQAKFADIPPTPEQESCATSGEKSPSNFINYDKELDKEIVNAYITEIKKRLKESGLPENIDEEKLSSEFIESQFFKNLKKMILGELEDDQYVKPDIASSEQSLDETKSKMKLFSEADNKKSEQQKISKIEDGKMKQVKEIDEIYHIPEKNEAKKEEKILETEQEEKKECPKKTCLKSQLGMAEPGKIIEEEQTPNWAFDRNISKYKKQSLIFDSTWDLVEKHSSCKLESQTMLTQTQTCLGGEHGSKAHSMIRQSPKTRAQPIDHFSYNAQPTPFFIRRQTVPTNDFRRPQAMHVASSFSLPQMSKPIPPAQQLAMSREKSVAHQQGTHYEHVSPKHFQPFNFKEPETIRVPAMTPFAHFTPRQGYANSIKPQQINQLYRRRSAEIPKRQFQFPSVFHSRRTYPETQAPSQPSLSTTYFSRIQPSISQTFAKSPQPSKMPGRSLEHEGEYFNSQPILISRGSSMVSDQYGRRSIKFSDLDVYTGLKATNERNDIPPMPPPRRLRKKSTSPMVQLEHHKNSEASAHTTVPTLVNKQYIRGVRIQVKPDVYQSNVREQNQNIFKTSQFPLKTYYQNVYKLPQTAHLPETATQFPQNVLHVPRAAFNNPPSTLTSPQTAATLSQTELNHHYKFIPKTAGFHNHPSQQINFGFSHSEPNFRETPSKSSSTIPPVFYNSYFTNAQGKFNNLTEDFDDDDELYPYIGAIEPQSCSNSMHIPCELNDIGLEKAYQNYPPYFYKRKLLK